MAVTGEGEAVMTPRTASWDSVEEQLSRVHWHILREDSLRASVAARAGTLLSTNALVVAGIALAVGLSGRRAGALVITGTVATFACVFGSVTSAVLATVSLFPWDRRYPDQANMRGTVYCPIEHGSGAATFEDFMQQRATESPERVLNEALRELWQCTQLHCDRYRWLRGGLRWLLAALFCLLITVGLTVS
jgi:hypothetical protein